MCVCVCVPVCVCVCVCACECGFHVHVVHTSLTSLMLLNTCTCIYDDVFSPRLASLSSSFAIAAAATARWALPVANSEA